MNRRTLPTTLALVLCTLPAFAEGPQPAGRDPATVGPWLVGQFEQGLSIHGVAGDAALIFTLLPTAVPGQPLGVYVLDRATGEHLGQLSPPPGGFLSPMAAKLVSYSGGGENTSGTLVVLDGFPPEMIATAEAALYEYVYSYSPSRGFESTLTASLAIPNFSGIDAGTGLPNGLIYPGSIGLLPDGRTIIIDMFLGTVWIADDSWSGIQCVLADPRFGSGPLPLIEGYARAAAGGTRPYSFVTPTFPGAPGPMAPGIHAVAYAALTDEVLFMRTATPGGLFAISRALMLDPTVPPFAKRDGIREVVPPTPGLSDYAVGMDYDRFHPSTPWVYWQRTICTDPTGEGECNVLRRVHLLTGEIQRLASSSTWFDWTNEISVLPPRGLGATPLTVLVFANMQEENHPSSNILLGGVATFVGPSLVPALIVVDPPAGGP